eukprot:CAMPEP_0185030432 /NCGR_PEP_ID=MMETSP1103-20130426/17400_1 /TAXON_ID=36769 /ORGANISM="Paraphysomonas bandaiensis, Strain Caron Lab Isolate" /LENGTH=93 /DNA_ID=CAMNT_0027565565 /DNA_START=566 /DNA_END=847 /DNA_ORIENTATION=+
MDIRDGSRAIADAINTPPMECDTHACLEWPLISRTVRANSGMLLVVISLMPYTAFLFSSLMNGVDIPFPRISGTNTLFPALARYGPSPFPLGE